MTQLTPDLRQIIRSEVEQYASLILAYQNPKFDPAPLTDLFNEQASDWDYNNAVCLVRAAALAYERKEIIELEVSRCPEKTQFKFFEGYKTNTQAFAVVFNNSVIIAFRGTETEDRHAQIKDLVTDTKFELVSFEAEAGESKIGNAKVHKGFQSALDEIWSDVITFIQDNSEDVLPSSEAKINNSKRKIWLTGHSLGGALATVAAAKLIVHPGFGESNIGGLYTIGQPRVGNQEFAEIISKPLKESRVARLVNNNDLVTMLPLTKMGYWHICGRRYINDKGELTHNMSDKLIKEDRKKGQARWFVTFVLVFIIKRFGVKINLPSIIVDHDRFNYLTLIKKARHLKILHQDKEFEQKPLSGLFSSSTKRNT